jgi:hypothetical protein
MTTDEVKLFLETFQALMMASITPSGMPHASTAPFAREGNIFYILISTVAQHGRNLLASSHVSLLFAEDESNCSQPFARKRITIEATVTQISRDSRAFEAGVGFLKNRFDSELVESLRKMGDFHLFALTAQSGSAVMGFGQAYRFDENLEIMAQINASHQHSK